jgi:hypothetical protein
MIAARTFALSLLFGMLVAPVRTSAQDAPLVEPVPPPTEIPPTPPSIGPESMEPSTQPPPIQLVPPIIERHVPPPPPAPGSTASPKMTPAISTPNSTEAEAPAVGEDVPSREAKYDWNGLFGPFEIGPVVGAGLPSLINFGVTAKLTHYVGAGINVGIIPTLKISYYGQATLAYQEYDVYARVYPFGGSLFLGTGIGYKMVDGTLARTVDLTSYQQGLPAGLLPNSVTYASQGSVKTLVLTPQVGLFHTYRCGFSLGFDVGLQVPIAPSQVTFKSQVNLLTDPQIPAATRQQLKDQYVTPTDNQVRGTLETIGRTIIPTFTVRIGWLL